MPAGEGGDGTQDRRVDARPGAAGADDATIHVDVPARPPPIGEAPPGEPPVPVGVEEPSWYDNLSTALLIVIGILMLVTLAAAIVAGGGSADDDAPITVTWPTGSAPTSIPPEQDGPPPQAPLAPAPPPPASPSPSPPAAPSPAPSSPVTNPGSTTVPATATTGSTP